MFNFMSHWGKFAGFCFLAVLISSGFMRAAEATPISVSETSTYDAAVVSADVEGDLFSNVLTLNNMSPTSRLTIDVSGAVPVSTPLPSQAINQCAIIACFTITMAPHLTPQLVAPAWNFDVGGTIDFNTSTANLTAAPAGDGVFGTLTLQSTPTYAVTSDNFISLGVSPTIANALNGPGAKITLKASAYWDSVT